MTFKQFKQWCNDRACDGCWGFNDAKFCVELLDNMNRIPWWRRKKTWNKIVNRVEFAVVNPINKKIQDRMKTNADRCVCCGAVIPEGQMVCPNCLVAVNESNKGGR